MNVEHTDKPPVDVLHEMPAFNNGPRALCTKVPGARCRDCLFFGLVERPGGVLERWELRDGFSGTGRQFPVPCGRWVWGGGAQHEAFLHMALDECVSDMWTAYTTSHGCCKFIPRTVARYSDEC